MKYITWNDSVIVTCQPYAYMCEICRDQIHDKTCRAIRVEMNGKTSNHYFHERHLAQQYADWLHKLNEKIKSYGLTETTT